MASTCNRPDCDGAVTMVDDNGATDPDVTRLEFYECEFGHRFREVLTA